MKSFKVLSFEFGNDYNNYSKLERYRGENYSAISYMGGAKFCFVNNKLSKKYPYITLMIGPNGTGKSTVLREISKILISLRLRQEDGRFLKSSLRTKHDYRLEYTVDDEHVVIINGKEFIVNGVSVFNIDALPLPKKIVVNTLGISDKFITKALSPTSMNRAVPYTLDFYEYIGAKSDNFASSSYGFVQRALDFLVDAFGKKRAIKNIAEVFSYLGFKPLISITYRIKSHSSIGKELSSIRQVDNVELTRELINIAAGHRGNSMDWVESIQSDDSLIYDITKFIIQANNEETNKLSYELDFIDVEQTNLSTSDFNIISILRKLRLVEFQFIKVTKLNGNTFDLRESSSGEIQILVSFLSMASVVEDGSLVLIDEPEISLHPNWQMRYMELIYKVFGHFANAHFIIATHSHFLVSDLRPEASSVLSISINESGICSDIIERDTFGLSAEDILYNVFKVRTTRNYYLEAELREALKIVSENINSTNRIAVESVNRLKFLNLKFKEISLDIHDPLNKIIHEISKFLEKNDKANA